MTERVLGFYEDQHSELGQMALRSRRRTRAPVGVADHHMQLPPHVRVLAMSDRAYDPLTAEELPVFRYDRLRSVWNIVQVGAALAGYLALTINGTRFLLECRRESLTDVERAIPGLRATVFPGLWELDFGRLSDKASSIEIAAEDITADEDQTLCELFDDEDSVVFAGALIVRQEGWCSVPDPGRPSGLQVVHRKVVDAIPYETGAVGRGSIGLAGWMHDAGFVVTSWQCRHFSHATGYDQTADPAIGGA